MSVRTFAAGGLLRRNSWCNGQESPAPGRRRRQPGLTGDRAAVIGVSLAPGVSGRVEPSNAELGETFEQHFENELGVATEDEQLESRHRIQRIDSRERDAEVPEARMGYAADWKQPRIEVEAAMFGEASSGRGRDASGARRRPVARPALRIGGPCDAHTEGHNVL